MAEKVLEGVIVELSERVGHEVRLQKEQRESIEHLLRGDEWFSQEFSLPSLCHCKSYAWWSGKRFLLFSIGYLSPSRKYCKGSDTGSVVSWDNPRNLFNRCVPRGSLWEPSTINICLGREGTRSCISTDSERQRLAAASGNVASTSWWVPHNRDLDRKKVCSRILIWFRQTHVIIISRIRHCLCILNFEIWL